MSLKKNNPGCLCCTATTPATPCSFCSTGTTPNTITVTITGMANGGCADCSYWNASHICTPTTNPCLYWSGPTVAPCATSTGGEYRYNVAPQFTALGMRLQLALTAYSSTGVKRIELVNYAVAPSTAPPINCSLPRNFAYVNAGFVYGCANSTALTISSV